MSSHYLDRLFAPRAIALFGASERPDSVGARVWENLKAGGFDGPLFPINPRRPSLNDEPCYPSIRAVPQPVDLVVIATPAATVPEILHDCGEQGVRAAVVLSAGFGEAGDSGKRLEKALTDEARRYGMRVLGPNCLGLIRPSAKMNATFSKNAAMEGSLALVSQSGAICTAILDWAAPQGIGFSAVASLGDAPDIDFGDVLDYLATDIETRSILLYVEGIRNSRSFLSGLRTAARMKPVIVIKAGRHAEGSRAAMSHTGALVGADDVFDAALRRAGAVRAMTIEQLFAAAQLLSTHHRVRGNRLAIVTNAGGPGVLATDRAVDLGVQMAELTDETLAGLDDALPAHWSHGNPVDILGDAPPERYRQAVELCLKDRGVDGVLVMLSPQAMTDPTAAAEAVGEVARGAEKPVLTCWMGGEHTNEGRALLTSKRVPTFPNPEASVEAFGYLANHHTSQKLLLQVPGPLGASTEPDVEGARLIIEGALAEKRKVLTGSESKALLSAFRIPVMPAMRASSAGDALVAAESVGFPVALKVDSRDITHKSDVNGVRLNITDAHAVRRTYSDLVATAQEAAPGARIDGVSVEKMYRGTHGRELMVGIVRDPVFGPVLSFGSGGTAVEVQKDKAVALPPVNTFIARGLIDRTRVSRMLGRFRNLPETNLEAIEDVLRRLSEMACELPQIQELDINPLMADENGAVVLDARVVVASPTPGAGMYDHMAIHPYPGHLHSSFQLADGTDIVIRPIRPEDAQAEAAFIRNLSDQSRYFRFMQTLRELTAEMLVRFTQIDYDREMALIAVTRKGDADIQIAVGRYVTNPDGQSCEFALVVADEWHRKGIGSRIMTGLFDAARARGLKTMTGDVLKDNEDMLKLVQNLGFTARPSAEDPAVVEVVRPL